jgi:hypothetical protein
MTVPARPADATVFHYEDIVSGHECPRIGATASITARTISLTAWEVHPSAAVATAPHRCSGMTACGLFPEGVFPDPWALPPATGCPYLEGRRQASVGTQR